MLDMQHKAAKRSRWLVLCTALAVALGVLLLISLLWGGSDGKDRADDGSRPGGPGSKRSPMPTQTDDGTYVDPARWVALPTGHKKRDGLPYKFPHTDEGAVSMLAAAARGGTSWDADRAETSARLYSHPDDVDKAALVARQSAAGARDHVGVPTKGKLPQGAALTAWPIGVQWKPVDEDHVRGYVLMRLRYTPGGGTKEKTELLSIPGEAAWVGGDWKSQPTKPSMHRSAPEAFELGTDGFNREGWKGIQEGERR